MAGGCCGASCTGEACLCGSFSVCDDRYEGDEEAKYEHASGCLYEELDLEGFKEGDCDTCEGCVSENLADKRHEAERERESETHTISVER